MKDIISAIEKNLFNYSLCFGKVPGGQSYDGLDIKWAYSGGKHPNRVFGASFSEKEADNRISDILSKFQSWGVPFTWIKGPSTRPDDIGKHLENHGIIRTHGWTGMAADLNAFSLGKVYTPGLSFIEAIDRETIEVFSCLAIEGFNISEHLRSGFRDTITKMGAGNNKPWRNFIALLDGTPVSSCTLYKEDEIAGIYWVATIPSARGKGIAGTLVSYVLSKAAEDGCTLSILQASDAGKKVYEKIGFREYCKFDIHAWNPSL